MTPEGALVVDSDSSTIAYAVPDDPAEAMAYVTGLFAGHGFTAEERERDSGYETASFTEGTGACSSQVTVIGATGGSQVELRYGAACPRG